MSTKQFTIDSHLFPKSASQALYTMYKHQLASKIKALEAKTDYLIPSNKSFVIRLDGVAFHTFTKGLEKPFDSRLTRAFIETTKDLVQKFSPSTGYTHSDEISLVFASVKDLKETLPHINHHIYGGRIQKLTSVLASFASARLNFHLSRMNWDNVSESIRDKMSQGLGYFDGRVTILEDEIISDCIFWRSNFDGLRNALFAISQSYYTHKELHGKGLSCQLQMLYQDFNLNVFETYSSCDLFGTWVKREQFTGTGKNLKTGEIVENVVRTRIATGSFNWADWDLEQRNEFVLSKFWMDHHPPRNPV